MNLKKPLDNEAGMRRAGLKGHNSLLIRCMIMFDFNSIILLSGRVVFLQYFYIVLDKIDTYMETYCQVVKIF